jgi:hypothetical protein
MALKHWLSFNTLRLEATPFAIGEDFFNAAFWVSPNSIIYRSCPSCSEVSQNVYYKRITRRRTFKPYYYVFNNWRSCDNLLNDDFELYSTYLDALQSVNK